MKGSWISLALAVAIGFAPGAVVAQESGAQESDAQETAEQETDDGTPQTSSAAAMEGAQERARLHFHSGASYYEAGSYEDALREFRHAYELSGRPELLYNLSLCYQQLGQLDAAISHLRRYLTEVEEIPNRANLELRVENLQRRADEEREAEARREAEPESQPATQSASSSDPEEPSAPPAAVSGGGPNIGAIAGFSVAAVGVVMAGVFGGLTLAEDGNLAGTCSPGCAADEVSTLQTWALLTDIGFGVALAGATAGLILLLVGGDDDEEHATVYPWFDHQSGGLALRGEIR